MRLFSIFGVLSGLLLMAFPAHGQSYVTATTAKPKAQKSYQLAVEAGMGTRYARALEELKKALELEPNFIDALIYRGSVQYDLQEYRLAQADFERALELDPDYDVFVWYQAALAAYRRGAYAEAIPFLEGFLRRADRKDRLYGRATEYLVQSRFAAEGMANPVPFSPENLGQAINSDAPEYLPSLTADGRTLVFTRVVGRQEDFFLSKKQEDGSWSKARAISEINTPGNEGAQSISADGQFLFFAACDRRDGYGSCDLYFSERRNQTWTAPKNVGSPINSRSWESQPSLSADGGSLFFSNNRPGGKGEKDIWVSHRQAGGPVPRRCLQGIA